TLDYPNIEVKSAFAMTLIRRYIGLPEESAQSLYETLPSALTTGDIKKAIDAIIACLASINYEITAPLEYYYETAIVLIFRIFGLDCRPEARIASGRIDTLVETSAFVYCFEFKLNNDAVAALAQINDKGYLTPWKGKGKVLFEVGVGIDKKKRNIGDWGYRTCNVDGVMSEVVMHRSANAPVDSDSARM
ncbi:MAG: PD-(D/E)XK nuclease domain-containing protein, partial [Polyangiaceae bacterium]|nr:PD-(D/E)XK nuclease domain-containing protein [Polyangiaceae bacterium]